VNYDATTEMDRLAEIEVSADTVMPTPPAEGLIARSQRVAKATAALRRIVLPYPRQIAFQAELEELRLTGLACKGMPQLGLTLFDQTGCGKTVGARQYKLFNESRADIPAGGRPVLHVRMDANGTGRGLFDAILAELDDSFTGRGFEPNLMRRAIDLMEEKGTQLLIVDEAQHGNRKGLNAHITASVKLLLDVGPVPIALLGTEEAVPVFGRDRELSGRLSAPCTLGALRWHDDEDQELWVGFLGALDQEMVDRGIVSAHVGLDDEQLAAALCDACSGVIGQLMNLVRTALVTAVRRGDTVFTVDDISDAVEAHLMQLGFIDHNPLRGL
jgi:hypothetical protein